MKLKNFTKKKAVAFGLAAGVAAGAGGIAVAFFSAPGSGTGNADVGSASALTITQVGAGYDSLIASTGNTYTSSQCFKACAGYTEIGDAVSLAYLTPKWANTHYAQVTSVTVPLVNFGSAKTQTVTLKLYNSPNTATYTFTKTVTIAAGSPTNQIVTLVTFDLAKTSVFVEQTFVYGVELTSNTGGVNIAMAHHATELAVGGTPNNTVYYAKNGGTYKATTAATTGYIPAVQINVIGGVVPPLYPGAPAQPVQYAITNPNPGHVRVSTITTAVKTTGTTIFGATGCKAAWFTLVNSAYSYNTNVAPGTTVVSGPTTLRMITNSATQNACIGHSVPLTFTSN